jgi:transcriptional regulator with GAF, ATPase, and Fis domain
VTSPWVAFRGAEASAGAAELLDALRAVGVEPEVRSDAPSAGRGIVVLDGQLPDACEFVRMWSQGGAERVLVMLTRPAAMTSALVWSLMGAGASDVIACAAAVPAAAVAAARLERWAVVDELIASPEVSGRLVGESRRWQVLLRDLVDAARFTDAFVLLTGESGTGKELLARLIHALDPRPRKEALVVLDCATVVPTLSGSEFFGHERGAFTGAIAMREGAFARADGGTLFLDEIGELPAPLQAELLRVMQEGTYKRVGSDTWRQTRFRLICATNRDIGDDAGTDFRRDLYHRIAGWTFRVPSLRERPEDIMPLIQHFLAEARPEDAPFEIDEPVRELLLTRSYPGNIRDLRHLVLRIAARHVGSGPITVGAVPTEERPVDGHGDAWPDDAFEQGIRSAVAAGRSLRDITAAAGETAVGIAVEDAGGNLARASLRLGVTPRALQLRRTAARGDGAAASPGSGPARTTDPAPPGRGAAATDGEEGGDGASGRAR